MLEPGQIFAGRYRVVRLLAPGGMGAVFEAVHTGTDRRVALKLLWPHVMAVQSAREKFEFEAKVAARVQSEHIVHVLDAGFDETSRSPYLVMELLPGGTLAAHVEREGRLGVELAVLILQQVAKGLDAAHGLQDEKGAPSPIIHRDLKPENLLLVVRGDGPPVVKILDFGIAKVLSESRNMSHEVRGTPMFMAYEQVTAEKLSPQTDIWALGLIAYFMLTGRRYWKSADDPHASLQALFAEIVVLPIVPASKRLAEQGLDVHLPDAFDPWLQRCLDRVPERRFESASAAVIALEAALRVKAPPPAWAAPTVPVFAAGPSAASAAGRSSDGHTRHQATATFPQMPGPHAPLSSTSASLPAIESRWSVLRTRRAEGIRVPLAGAALGAGALLLAGVAVVWWLSSEPEPTARVAGALLPAPPPEPERQQPPALAAPAPRVEPAALPRWEQPTAPITAPSPAPSPTVRPLPPDAVSEPEPEPEPVDQPAPPPRKQRPAQSLPPPGTKRTESRTPEKARGDSSQRSPLNGFDVR